MVLLPMPRASADAAIFSHASSVGSPENSSECTLSPCSVSASLIVAPSAASCPGSLTTTRTGSPYVRANSKSRWSCAGTAMMAPVP